MKVRLLLWLLSTILNIICSLYHEMCHWIVAMIFYILGYFTRPYLTIDGMPRLERNSCGGYTTYTSSMSVNYSYIVGETKPWMHRMVTIAPAFGFVILILVSPIYLLPVYISNYDALWLSRGDIESLQS